MRSQKILIQIKERRIGRNSVSKMSGNGSYGHKLLNTFVQFRDPDKRMEQQAARGS